MKLKQVLAVMLSSVMVLSAAPTEVFAFDDPGVLTDSSGGIADGEAGQLEAGNAKQMGILTKVRRKRILQRGHLM